MFLVSHEWIDYNHSIWQSSHLYPHIHQKLQTVEDQHSSCQETHCLKPRSCVFWLGKLLCWKWFMVISWWHLFLDITAWVTVLCVRNTSRFLKWNNSLRQSGKILVHYCVHSMSMRIHLRHYCLNMTPCRWPPCHSLHSCSRSGQAVITHCSISLGIPWIHSRSCCFRSSVLAGHVSYTLLLT